MVVINKPKIEQQQQQKKPLPLKTKLIFGLVLLLLAVSGTFYYYFTSTQAQLKKTAQVQSTFDQLQQEKENCNQVISQGEGQFDQYEYCTRLLNTFK